MVLLIGGPMKLRWHQTCESWSNGLHEHLRGQTCLTVMQAYIEKSEKRSLQHLYLIWKFMLLHTCSLDVRPLFFISISGSKDRDCNLYMVLVGTRYPWTSIICFSLLSSWRTSPYLLNKMTLLPAGITSVKFSNILVQLMFSNTPPQQLKVEIFSGCGAFTQAMKESGFRGVSFDAPRTIVCHICFLRNACFLWPWFNWQHFKCSS